MIACPNKNFRTNPDQKLSDWDSLVNNIGEIPALTAFIENNYNIPAMGTPVAVADNTLVNLQKADEDYSSTTAEELKATIKEVAIRAANRIGGTVDFYFDKYEPIRGKNAGMKSSINLAKARLDTPIHEILGHPIIKVLKLLSKEQRTKFVWDEHYAVVITPTEDNLYWSYTEIGLTNKTQVEPANIQIFDSKEEAETYHDIRKRNFEKEIITPARNNLYNNLLKELETGRGKEVLDRVQKDYNDKEDYVVNKANLLKQLQHYSDNIIDINNIVINRVFNNETNTFTIKSISYNAVYDIGMGKTRESEHSYNITKDSFSDKLLEKAKYTLEEQQEEAIVELLGMLTAEKLDKIKDSSLIALLKELLKTISDFVKTLITAKEIVVEDLPEELTLEDLANIFAYSESKIILPGYKAEYKTPDGQVFSTNAEAQRHLTKLLYQEPQLIEEEEDQDYVSSITYFHKNKIYRFKINPSIGTDQPFNVIYGLDIRTNDNAWFLVSEDNTFSRKLTEEEVINYYNNELYSSNKDFKQGRFLSINKELEEGLAIIEAYKKENNIKYNPQEAYNRDQEFISVMGAYGGVDIDIFIANLQQHVIDHAKAGSRFDLSVTTAKKNSSYRNIKGHFKGNRIIIKFYPQPEDINWVSNTDNYSGSVRREDIHAADVVSTKPGEVVGVSFTKSPSKQNLYSIKPSIAEAIDNVAGYTELAVQITENNHRIIYESDVPYATKRLIDKYNQWLDTKYGKVKELPKSDMTTLKYEVWIDPLQEYIDSGWDIEFIKRFDTPEEAQEFILEAQERYSAGALYMKEVAKPAETAQKEVVSIKEVTDKMFPNIVKPDISQLYVEETMLGNNAIDESGNYIQEYAVITNGGLETGFVFATIEAAQAQVDELNKGVESSKFYEVEQRNRLDIKYVFLSDNKFIKEAINKLDLIDGFKTERELLNKRLLVINTAIEFYNDELKNSNKYNINTNRQLEINKKIADLKEAELRYPRGLVTSSVVPDGTSMVNDGTIAWQKVESTENPKKAKVEGINIFTKSTDKLGRQLTNPNWGAKEIMDIEAVYKANASRIKAPQLDAQAALVYDKNLMYSLQVQKFRNHPELIEEINKRGGLDFILASSHETGEKNSRWTGTGMESNFIQVLAKSYETVAKELNKFIDKSAEQQITKPSNSTKPDVILPIGTSGSGKSTWISSINKDNKFVVISPDEMRVEFTGDMNDKSKDKEIYEEAAKRTIQAIKDGKQVIFDTTNLTKDKRRPFINAIKAALPNANIQYKLMPLNPELAKQRIKADIAAGKNRANVPDATIDRHAISYAEMLEDIKSEDISNYDDVVTTTNNTPIVDSLSEDKKARKSSRYKGMESLQRQFTLTDIEIYVNHISLRAMQFINKFADVTNADKIANPGKYDIKANILVALKKHTNSLLLQGDKEGATETKRIVNNFDDFWNLAVEEVDRKLNYDISDEQMPAKYDGNTKLTKTWDDAAAFSISSKESFDKEIKRIIMTTPKVANTDFAYRGGEFVYTNDDERFSRDNKARLITGLDFNTLYPFILSQMSGLSTDQEMMDRLYYLKDTEPSMLLLWDKISKDPLLRNKWFANFNKAYYPAKYYRISDTAGKLIIRRDTANKQFVLADTWSNRLKVLITYSNNNPEKTVFSKALLSEITALINSKGSLEDRIKNVALAYQKIGIDLKSDVLSKIVNNPLFWAEAETAEEFFDKEIVLNFKKIGNTLFNQKEIKFNAQGYINKVAEYAQVYYYNVIESSYYTGGGESVYSYNKPNFLTRFFNKFTRLNKVDSLDATKDKQDILDFIKEYMQDTGMIFSNWVYENGSNNTFLKVRQGEKTLEELTIDDLNIEAIKNFEFNLLDTVKQENSNVVVDYSSMSGEDWKMFTLLEYLNGAKGFANIPILIQSDSSNIYTLQLPKISIYEAGSVFTDKGIKRSSKLFKAVENTVIQEIARMQVAKNLLFDEIKNDAGVVIGLSPKQFDNAMLASLEQGYHYDTLGKDGQPILLDSAGFPTGRVFKFQNTNYSSATGEIISLNNSPELFSFGIFRRDMVRNLIINDHIESFINDLVKSHLKIYKSFEGNITIAEKGKKTKLLSSYSNYADFIAEFAINTYLSNVEQSNWMSGLLGQYKSWVESNKRAKQLTSPAQTAGTAYRGVTYKAAVVEDANLASSYLQGIKASLISSLKNKYPGLVYREKTKAKRNALEIEVDKILKAYSRTTVSDGQSYMTLDRLEKVLKDFGRWNKKYEMLFAKIKAGATLTENDISLLLVPMKPYYYYKNVNGNTSSVRSTQVKTAIIPLIPQLIKGTGLERVLANMEKNSVDEIYFKSAVKVGGTYTNKILDNKGNVLKNFDLIAADYYNEGWGLQLDLPQHLKDQQNKLGIQIAKLIFSNLPATTQFAVGSTTYTGEQLFKLFTDLQEANLKQDLNTLLEELGVFRFEELYDALDSLNTGRVSDPSFGFTDYNKVAEILKDEIIKRNLPLHYLNFIELDPLDNTFKIPLSLGFLGNKFQQILTALFTNRITDQKFPGGHVALISDIMFTHIENPTDLGIEFISTGEKGKEVQERLKSGNFRLQPPIIVNETTLKVEAIMPAWSKKFFKNGNRVSINEIPEELRTMVGYRIPTEEKYSMVVLEVIGFAPEGLDTFAILPGELVTKTGWDFDIDTLYLMQKTFDVNLKEYKYTTDRDKLFRQFVINRTNVNIYKDFAEDKKAIIKDFAEFYGVPADNLGEVFDYLNQLIADEKERQSLLDWIDNSDITALRFDIEYVKAIGQEIAEAKARIATTEEMYRDEFNAYTTEELNSKAARNNRIFDIFKGILSSPDIYAQAMTPGAFSDMADLKTKVEKLIGDSGSRYNPHTRAGQDSFRDKNISGVILKGISASINGALPIFQQTESQFSDDLAFTIIENGETKIYKAIGKRDDGTVYGENGNLITNGTAQLLGNTVDIVKEGFPYNINVETVYIFSAMLITGISIDYAGTFIRQPIVNKYVSTVINDKTLFGSNKSNAYSKVKREYQTKLYHLMVSEGLIDTKDAVKRKQLVLNKEKNKWEWSAKPIYLREDESAILEVPGTTAWSVEELNDMLAVENPYTVSKLSNADKIKFLREQLALLERYRVYENTGQALQSNVNLLVTDKMGIGPNINVTREWSERVSEEINNSLDNDSGIFTKDGEALLSAIYSNEESAYAPLANYVTYGNAPGYNILSKLFFTTSNNFNNFKDILNIKNGDALVDNYLLQALVSMMPYAQALNTPEILGINKEFTPVFDFTSQSIEEFDALSTANKLFLIKNNLTTVLAKERAHFLNFLEPNIDANVIKRRGFHFINFNKPKSTDNIDDTIIISFEKLINSDNKFLANLGKSLVDYNVALYGLNFASNSWSNYIPATYLVNTMQVDKAFKNYEFRLNSGETLVSYDTDTFYRNNWDNTNIVPQVYSNYAKDASGRYLMEEDEYGQPLGYEVIDNKPDWSAASNSSILPISKKRLAKEDSKIKRAKFLLISKLVKGEKVTTLFKRYFTGIREIDNIYDTKISNAVYYYPIGKLGGKLKNTEFTANSMYAENNVAYPAEVFEKMLEHKYLGNTLTPSEAKAIIEAERNEDKSCK